MTAHEEHIAGPPLHEVAECTDHPSLTLRTGLTVREGKIEMLPRVLDDLLPVLHRPWRQFPFPQVLDVLDPASCGIGEGSDRLHRSSVGTRINHVNREGR